MIDELRFYRMHPGKLEEYLELSQRIAIPFRGHDYGRLLGFWTVGAGTLSSIANLWRHESLATREALRARMSEAEVWQDYMARTHPLNQHQTVRILAPVLPLEMPTTRGNTYELRFLNAHTGKAAAVAKALRDAPPRGPGGDGTIAVWTNLFGDIYEVVCLSAHADYGQSLRGRWAEAWRDFLRGHGAMIEGVTSQVLLPIPASPLD